MSLSSKRRLTIVAAAMLAPQLIYGAIAFANERATFTWIDPLAGDQTCYAYAISADGSTVVGASYTDPSSPTGVVRAFRWTRAGGLQAIGDLPGGSLRSEAFGVSGDGSVIAGSSSSALSYGHSPYYYEPFVWSAASGMQPLGFIPGTNGKGGTATQVSGNGAVIVGSSTGQNGTSPFRWSAASGMVDLGDLGPSWGNQDTAIDVNSDGSVIVGMNQLRFDRTAFLWTSTGGMRSLGSLLTAASPASRERFSSASATSEDGSVVVGSAYSDDGGIEAFRWTPGTGMKGLGKLPQAAFPQSLAAAISADGTVIVGEANSAQGTRAIIWNSTGMHVLQDLLFSKGAGRGIGSGVLKAAYDVSANGRTIAGWGNGPKGIQGWVATFVPEPASGMAFATPIIAALATQRRRRASHRRPDGVPRGGRRRSPLAT